MKSFCFGISIFLILFNIAQAQTRCIPNRSYSIGYFGCGSRPWVPPPRGKACCINPPIYIPPRCSCGYYRDPYYYDRELQYYTNEYPFRHQYYYWW